MEIKEPPPFYFFGIPLHSRKVGQQFCLVFILMILIPFTLFFGLRESLGDVGAGLGAVIAVQGVMFTYAYIIIKDPENFPNAEKVRKEQAEKTQKKYIELKETKIKKVKHE